MNSGTTTSLAGGSPEITAPVRLEGQTDSEVLFNWLLVNRYLWMLESAYDAELERILDKGCCNQIWSAIAAIEPTEPRRLRDPFLYALVRVLEEALKTYEILNLELDFLETWKVFDRIDAHSRSRISGRAYKAFGQEVAHRMVREVSRSRDERGPRTERGKPG